ncbi:MAG: GNAT family N-acetyltransferase [Thermoplasmata archaeon]
MIREFRPREAPRLLSLLRESFPEEEALYGTRPDAWARVVDRIYRWDLRLVLGLLRAVGRPVFRFLVAEEEGRMVGTSIVSFGPRAGYISTVMVDPSWRRRGIARGLIRACETVTARVRRPYVALDVLAHNAPAIALYEAEGYRPLRSSALLALPFASPGDGVASVGPPLGPVRPYRADDREAVVAIARASRPPPVAEVLPVSSRSMGVSGTLDRILSSESAAWVLVEGGRPVGYVGASVSDAMDAGTVASPLVAAEATPEGARSLFAAAVGWIREHGAARAVCQIARDQEGAMAAAGAVGLREAHGLITLFRAARRSAG